MVTFVLLRDTTGFGGSDTFDAESHDSSNDQYTQNSFSQSSLL